MKYNSLYLLLIILLFLLNINYILTQDKKDITELKKEFEQKDFDNIKNFPLKTLAYITPCNKEDYNYVEKYSNKFDIISPTWFELKPDEIDGELQIILDGSNNIDSSYMKKLRSKNEKILILPRLHSSFNDMNILETWFTKEADQFIKVLERRIKYNKFDGYVFDCMAIWFNKNLMEKFIKFFLPKIYEAMNKLNKIFILTIIPKDLNTMSNSNSFLIDKYIIKKISNYVHYLNIMTYDYHQYQKENPNFYTAPISWIEETINFYVDKNDKNVLKKILIGIPFHGYGFKKNSNIPSNVVTGTQFSQILSEINNNNINYYSYEEEGEYIYDNGYNIINYPNKKFIEKRLELSKKLNIGGIGIWDVGNGKENLLEPL